MYIGINNTQEVLMISDKIKLEDAEDMTVYKVDSVPLREAGMKLCFDPESEMFYHKDYTEHELAKASAARELFLKRERARRQKEAALQWLSDNDWKINKHVLGEWLDTDERWLEYVRERAKVRAEIDAADAILNT